MIQKAIRIKVEKLLNQPVSDAHPVSGGSINQAAKITMEDERHYFLKWNTSAATDMFPKEQQGLELLRSAKSGLRIPDVTATGKTGDNIDFILMEFIPKGSAHTNSARRLGEQLAALHQTTADAYGLNHDNYIGRLPQSNTPHADWIEFFVEERLKPQVRMAVDDGKFSETTTKNFQKLYKKLPNILADEPASLLHGDLWSGNFMVDAKGQPAIYDPAVYYGNREIELAMTHLFGGFPSEFYAAYEQAFPLQAGFSRRKDIYNLYPLLVHANMFGGSYVRRVESTVQQFA